MAKRTIADELEDHWHKLLAIYMHKQGAKTVEIRPEDIEALTRDYKGEMPAITLKEVGDTIFITLLPLAQARVLAERYEKGD